LASPGAEGAPASTLTYVSADAGESWSEHGTVTQSPGFVSGIVPVEGGFVATGGAARDSSSNATGPAAWFSADARSWSAESVPVDSRGRLAFVGSADAWFGAPLPGATGVTAVMSNDNAAVSGVYTRGAGGAWSLAG